MQSLVSECLRQAIPPRYRARLESFFDENARCEEGSRCARQATALLELIHADLARERRAARGGETDKDVLRHDIFAAEPALRCGLTDAAFKRAIEVLNGEGGLLARRHSNALALATVGRAMLQAQRSTLQSDVGRLERTLVILEAFDAMLRVDYAPLSVLSAREQAEAKLALLKHRGKGIALLMAQRS